MELETKRKKRSWLSKGRVGKNICGRCLSKGRGVSEKLKANYGGSSARTEEGCVRRGWKDRQWGEYAGPCKL